MSNDNIIPFPDLLKDAISEADWQRLQSEFYLDCFRAAQGRDPEDPEELRAWLEQTRQFADTENPFFRGWLVRRLSEWERP